MTPKMKGDFNTNYESGSESEEYEEYDATQPVEDEASESLEEGEIADSQDTDEDGQASESEPELEPVKKTRKRKMKDADLPPKKRQTSRRVKPSNIPKLSILNGKTLFQRQFWQETEKGSAKWGEGNAAVNETWKELPEETRAKFTAQAKEFNVEAKQKWLQQMKDLGIEVEKKQKVRSKSEYDLFRERMWEKGTGFKENMERIAKEWKKKKARNQGNTK